MKVKVTYNPEITSQPTDLDSTLNVELDYEQSTGEIIPTPTNPTIGGQDVEIVESGDGLYEDSYESGRLIYRGQNPNNYIEFNDELWRIVAKETDGTYKIIRNETLPNRAYDEANHRSTANNTYCDDPYYGGCGVFAAVSGEFSTPSGSKKGTVTENSSIQEYLNGEYYTSNLNVTAKGQMTSHSFNIGAVEYLDESGAEADSIEKNIAGEKMYTWTGNVGLANVSDILKASLNPSCKSATDQYYKLMQDSPKITCDSNYLLEMPDMTGYWTINAFGSESGSFSIYSASAEAWLGVFVEGIGYVGSGNVGYGDLRGVRPAIYLSSDTTLSGLGTQENPFTIVS